ncbi:7685_t:CDS:1, partial [Cetraspora pellucida]
MHRLYNFLCYLLLSTLFVPIITSTFIYRSCHDPRFFFDPYSTTIDHFEKRNYEHECCVPCNCANDYCNHNCESSRGYDECGNFQDCDDLNFVICEPYEDIEAGSIRMSRPDRNHQSFCPPTTPI